MGTNIQNIKKGVLPVEPFEALYNTYQQDVFRFLLRLTVFVRDSIGETLWEEQHNDTEPRPKQYPLPDMSMSGIRTRSSTHSHAATAPEMTASICT